jgi:hypothetical protein
MAFAFKPLHLSEAGQSLTSPAAPLRSQVEAEAGRFAFEARPQRLWPQRWGQLVAFAG